MSNNNYLFNTDQRYIIEAYTNFMTHYLDYVNSVNTQLTHQEQTLNRSLQQTFVLQESQNSLLRDEQILRYRNTQPTQPTQPSHLHGLARRPRSSPPRPPQHSSSHHSPSPPGLSEQGISPASPNSPPGLSSRRPIHRIFNSNTTDSIFPSEPNTDISYNLLPHVTLNQSRYLLSNRQNTPHRDPMPPINNIIPIARVIRTDTNSDFISPVTVRPSFIQIINSTRTIRFEQIENPPNERCPISQEDFNIEDTVTQITHCNHVFNCASLLTWFEQNVRCPVCRFDIRDEPNETTITPTTLPVDIDISAISSSLPVNVIPVDAEDTNEQQTSMWQNIISNIQEDLTYGGGQAQTVVDENGGSSLVYNFVTINDDPLSLQSISSNASPHITRTTSTEEEIDNDSPIHSVNSATSETN